ncbi:MAG: GGDEF domain-containing protein [Pseudomonadota bacterium]
MSLDKNSNPSLIARETLKQLTSLKIPPTPDNYHKIYDEIAGNPTNRMSANTAKMLMELVSEFPRHTPTLLSYANALELSANEKNWPKYKNVLMKFVETEVAAADSSVTPNTAAAESSSVPWGTTIDVLVKQLESKQGSLTAVKKKEGLNRVLTKFSKDSVQLHIKLKALIDSWVVLAASSPEQAENLEEASPSQPTDQAARIVQSDQIESQSGHFADQLLELQAQMLEHVAGLPIGDADLAEEARRLAQQIRKVHDKQAMEQFVAGFKQFCLKFDSIGEEGARLQEGLLRLLNLLMDSTGELLSEDQWVREQLARLREAIATPLDLNNMAQAEHYLEEIIQRQEIIKRSLGEAKMTLKQMVTSLISNIEELSDTTGVYHDKLGEYSVKIRQTDDIETLNQFLVEIMQETKQMQKSTSDYRNDFLAARAEVSMAQDKINQLETELMEMGEKVHEDHLTGILNRRGLDSAFEREISRANRQQAPLCFALLDIDNFKQLNDTHGHKVGDDALIYLVEAFKDTTRPEDVVARYGGEEFVILLPGTEVEEAVAILSRIRRNLTKRFFLHENKRILITFSAGVAQYQPGELQENIFKRADEALYRAKKNGKNQILIAE